MLRNIGIRSKILAVLALPVIVLIVAASVISGSVFADASRSQKVSDLATSAGSFSQLIRGLQAERTLTTAAVMGDDEAATRLPSVRAQVDAGIATVGELIVDSDIASLSPEAGLAITESQAAHENLTRIRAGADSLSDSPASTFQQYSDVIAVDVELPSDIVSSLPDQSQARLLYAYTDLERTAEQAAQEREVGLQILARQDGAAPTRFRDLTQAIAFQEQSLAAFAGRADQRQINVLDKALSESDEVRVDFPQQRQEFVEASTTQSVDVDPVQWQKLTTERIDIFEDVTRAVAADAAVVALESAEQAQQRALTILAITVALVVVPLVLALFIARGITRPLQRLTVAAGELRVGLPAMVERMQTPGDGPGLALPDIPVESGDEVGRLAQAFNDVNRTTVEVAQEQAALRASIAEMFVNVARRNQVLLSRQLAFIDELERTEENPDTLDNLFRLDHLATRMRRNAESLLVLAGLEGGRRLRRPMPLSDVIRTASSEIEHYERVHLSLQADPPVVGHVSLLMAHLIAELLENATNFSDPGTRVIVSTAPSPGGIIVTVTDEGLGMTPEELDEINTRIANPPVTEVIGASRLGFFVVGRLARRLDAKVAIKAGRVQGTVVVMELPPALFLPGSVVELPSTEVQEIEAAPEADTATQGHEAGRTVERESPEPRVADAPNTLPRGGGATLPTRVRDAQPGAQPPTTPVQSRVPAPTTPGDDTPPAERRGLFTGFRARHTGDDAQREKLQLSAPQPPAPQPSTPQPVAAEPVQPDAHEPPTPSVGTAAHDILPSKLGRGGLRRRRPRQEPAPEPSVPAHPATGAPAHPVANAPAPLPQRSAEAGPVREQPAGEPQPLPTAVPASSTPSASPFASLFASVQADPYVPQAAPPLPLPTASPVNVSGATTEEHPEGEPQPAAPEPVPVGDVLRQRSALASEALTELSRLSTYRPAAVDRKPPTALTRRTPAATSAAEIQQPQTAPANRRNRDAADVRSMLSGFQAGVERGRTSPSAHRPMSESPSPSATGGPTP